MNVKYHFINSIGNDCMTCFLIFSKFIAMDLLDCTFRQLICYLGTYFSDLTKNVRFTKLSQTLGNLVNSGSTVLQIKLRDAYQMNIFKSLDK